RARGVGFDLHLVKPVELQAILEAVERLHRAWEAVRAATDDRLGARRSSSFPDRCLLRPGAVAIPAAEGRRRLLEGARVSRRLVARDACPVERLGRGVGLPKSIDDLAKLTLGVLPLLRLEGALAEAELQLGEAMVSLEKSLH